MGLFDKLSVIPLSTLEQDTGWDLSGLDTATEAFAKYSGADYMGSTARPVVNALTSPSAVQEAAEGLGDLKQYLSEIFETSENAARLQADRNETAAVNAWRRSEEAAENAMNRARRLRQSAYQDAVDSLKRAGLNPVLAAGGGISGSAVTAPQANAPASSSSMADGLNAADLLQSIAAMLSGAGSLIGSLSPKRIISDTTSNITSHNTNISESTNWNQSHIYSHKVGK